jgi:hypothetical protein
VKNPTLTSTLCTAPQLAMLAGVTPQFLSQHPDLLPEPTRQRIGRIGRPPRCWTIEDLADFIEKRTRGWSELELRLRAALLNPRLEAAMPPKPLFDEPVFDDDGRCLYLPPGVGLTAQQVAADAQACAARRQQDHLPASPCQNRQLRPSP